MTRKKLDELLESWLEARNLCLQASGCVTRAERAIAYHGFSGHYTHRGILYRIHNYDDIVTIEPLGKLDEFDEQ